MNDPEPRHDDAAGVVLRREQVTALYDVAQWCDLLQDAQVGGCSDHLIEGHRQHLHNAVNVAVSLGLPVAQVNAMLAGGPVVLLEPEHLYQR